jgi:hypothetical protein
MDSTRARSELEAAKQESGARAAEAGRLQAARKTADANAKGLLDAVQKAQEESERMAAEADRAKELADQAGMLVAARELMVKAADAQRALDEAQMQLDVAKVRKAPEADMKRLQEAVDKAKAALPPANEVDQATKAAEWADQQLQKERAQVKLGERIADLESQKARAEQAAKDAEARAQKARAGAAEAAAAVTDLLRQIDDAKSRLKAVETPPAGPSAPAPAPAAGA